MYTARAFVLWAVSLTTALCGMLLSLLYQTALSQLLLFVLLLSQSHIFNCLFPDLMMFKCEYVSFRIQFVSHQSSSLLRFICFFKFIKNLFIMPYVYPWHLKNLKQFVTEFSWFGETIIQPSFVNSAIGSSRCHILALSQVITCTGNSFLGHYINIF